MRGSVTDLMRNLGYGFILGEDGCVVCFDANALDGSSFTALTVGEWVEFESHRWGERVIATKVKPIPLPGHTR
ncbi:MAG: cold shock domain-containing protein [Candidatus Acidiferrales bacterium]